MPGQRRPPETPRKLPGSQWWGALKRTRREFQRDNMIDWAAALTYYGVLSLFPAIIVLTAVLGLLGPGTTQGLLGYVRQIAPGPAGDVAGTIVRQVQGSQSLAGVAGIVGVVVALWSASGYLGAFTRACNVIYDVEEGRPLWKVTVLRVVLTLSMIVLLGLCATGVVFTGGLADAAGRALGLGTTVVAVWNVAKWPVIVLLVSLAIAVLYWAAPNVRQPRFRWLTPGSLLAILVWLVASGGFGAYVANFGSYNKTYGSLAAVVVFLIWLWLSNIAILLGAEFDAELARGRSVAAGEPADREPFLPPRDTRAMEETPPHTE
ncbi:ribonuclease [Gandjariella thermophila]|uniref:Ribonuclease n=1 Tax=Gandjariella thermophila TaxID=1931992 RepID=A0A4D4J750_9PSEU|nr:ribonuclease [Gandjariella thermophila]